jgi:hypothetical protein
MADFEGALNESTASPAEDAFSEAIDETTEINDDQVGADDQDDVHEQPLNDSEQSDEDIDEHGNIPYERFKQINEKAKRADELTAQLERQKAEFQQTLALERKAISLRYESVDAYKAADATAKQLGYQSIDHYHEIERENNAAQQQKLADEQAVDAYGKKLELERPWMTDEDRELLLETQRIHMETKRENEQNRQWRDQQAHQARSAAVEREWSESRSMLESAGFRPNADLENLFRQTNPGTIAQVAKAMAASIPNLEQIKRDAVNEYLQGKRQDAGSITPETRSSGPAIRSTAPDDVKDPKGYKAWMDAEANKSLALSRR